MPDRQMDFLIVGAAKSSTTWLQVCLQACPQVFMPDPELHFFSREYHRGLDWYEGHFPDEKGPEMIFGEKSNSYMSDPDAAPRIAEAYPDVKIVMILRNPVERAYSDYCMLLRRGTVDNRIEDYLDPEKATFRRFVDDGLYGQQIARFTDYFPQSRILVHLFEDLRTQPNTELARLADHLGIERSALKPSQKKVKDKSAAMVPLPLRRVLKPLRPLLDPLRDTAPVRVLRSSVAKKVEYPKLSYDLTERLQAYYREDISRLSKLCDRELDGWLGGTAA